MRESYAGGWRLRTKQHHIDYLNTCPWRDVLTHLNTIGKSAVLKAGKIVDLI